MLKLKTLAVALTIALVALVALVVPAGTATADAPTLPQCATIDSLNCTGTFTNIRRGDGIFIQAVNGTTTSGASWPFLSVSTAREIYLLHRLYARCDTERNNLTDTIWSYQQQTATDDRIIASQAHQIDRKNARIAKQRRTIRHLRALLAKANAR